MKGFQGQSLEESLDKNFMQESLEELLGESLEESLVKISGKIPGLRRLTMYCYKHLLADGDSPCFVEQPYSHILRTICTGFVMVDYGILSIPISMCTLQ